MNCGVRLFGTPMYVADDYNISDNEKKVIYDLPYDSNPPAVVGGVGSTVNKNILNLPELSNILKHINKHLNAFVYDVLEFDRQHVFNVTQSWANALLDGASHHPHIHPNSIFSGVFFIDGDDAPITFEYDGFFNFPFRFKINNYNEMNSSSWDIENTPGRLVIFPSSVMHYVKTYKSASGLPRRSISFNTFIHGNLGDYQEATFLNIL